MDLLTSLVSFDAFGILEIIGKGKELAGIREEDIHAISRSQGLKIVV